ncbi:YhdP family protein [Sulfurospirillum sp. 1612]|uniref:YhdP family protein n=1 Tax=Sulfurospirillum sp. 1612 TaxID=3094835 RepID=UPI002F94E0AA
MIIKITSHIMRKLWITILFIILSLVILILSLMHGITINSITLPKLRINELYIKLDKKLIVESNQIKILRDSKAKNSAYEIYKLAKYGKYLNQFFQEISLKNVQYNDEVINLLYKDNVFYLNSNYLTIDAKLQDVSKGKINIDVKQMILKDYDIELVGKTILDLKKNIYDYSGKFDILNIDGHLNFKIEKDKVYYQASSEHFASLEPIMKYIEARVKLEPIVSAWIYKKIVAKDYKLNNIQGMFNLLSGDFFPKLMQANATLKEATIQFHPDVTPALAKKIDITLQDNKLIFHLDDPTFKGKKITINNIYIYNLLTTSNGIVVDITSNSLLDSTIHSILKAFNINIPITQSSGINHSNLYLDIKFLPYSIDAKGDFTVKDSILNIKGVNFFTKYATIRLDNNKIFIDHSNLAYKNIFDLNTTGIFKTDTQQYHGLVSINALDIGLKDNKLLQIKNLQDEPIKLTLKPNSSLFELKNLDTNLSFTANNNKISIQDLSKYQKFSPMMQDYNMSAGALYVTTKAFQNFDAHLQLRDFQTPFYVHDKKIKDLNITIKTNANAITALSHNKKIQLSYDDKLIVNLKDLDIQIANTSSKSTKKVANHDTIINGHHVNFKIKDLNATILSDHFTFKRMKKDTSFISVYKNSQIGYEDKGGRFYLEATKLNDVFVNTALHSNMVKDGTFKITANGDNFDIFDGNVEMNNTTLKDSALFNNLMAIINTIPSLVLFKNPNFNENGYFIKNGTIQFKRINQILSFQNINLHGYNTDIVGKGYINLDENSIHLDLQVKTLKDVSDAIKKIPVLGYIILGDDKSISTNISITGDLKNPKIKTQLLKDSVMTPIDILKRTIESPLKLFQ